MKNALRLTTAASAIAAAFAAFAADNASIRSYPPDLNTYARPATPDDRAAPPRAAAGPRATVFVVDTVVNNTDPNLKNTDLFNDGETSIAVNPKDTNQIAITAFSGSWGAAAPIWVSTNGGATWTKQFTVNPPPGVLPLGGPADQTIDYSERGLLAGTFLNVGAGVNIYSAFSTNLTTPSFNFFQSPPGVAQKTTHLNGVNNEDQPWLLIARRPLQTGEPISANERVFVAYDDFNTAPDMHVAAAPADEPMQFLVDRRTGFSTGGVNPGHRLATDPRNGWVYSLFQRNIAAGAGGSKNINYMLNRSKDGGVTWTLNGAANGAIIANADSTQPTPKFCTVNALLGGADHAAVDPVNGDVYYVYGNRDPGTGNNRLSIRKLTNNAAGGLTIGPQRFVTGQVQAAIPSVAVTQNHTIGVFYYTCDGLGGGGFPQFTAHFARSTNGGLTFTDTVLETFLSSAKDDGNPRQRVLGDYQQVKAVGNTFYGAFTGNGAPFGRAISNHDPIFFKIAVP